MGTPAMTTRGLQTTDFTAIAEFVHRAVEITAKVKQGMGAGAKLKEFREAVGANGEGVAREEVAGLKRDVTAFARRFPVIGFEQASMKY